MGTPMRILRIRSKFYDWVKNGRREPYNSFGNGSAMRVGSVGFAFDTLEEVLEWSKRSALVTHNHAEGSRRAGDSYCNLPCRKGISKEEIRVVLQARFYYNLHRRLKEIRPTYRFDETCQGTIPEALIAFLESKDYEDAVRNAISLGGDDDTLACIA
jgi:ADP-ribosylglycohydrolase